MIKSFCKVCGKEFYFYKSNKSGKYCSRACSFICPEWRLKQTLSKKGRKQSEEARKKMSLSRKGRIFTQEHINNLKESVKKYYDKNGRKSSEYILIKSSDNFKQWRKNIFERDNYTCTCCGNDKGGNLEAHHLVPFSVLLEESKISRENYLFNIENGITLCVGCHKKTLSYGRKAKYNEEMILIKSIKDLCQQNKEKEDFDTFYKKQMEKFINVVKEKLC